MKYRLTWAGQEDTPCLRAATEMVKTFPLFQDSEARLVNYEEYTSLVAAGEIDGPKFYWCIEPGQVGLISLDSYKTYSNTWDNIATAKSDFFRGWKACEEHSC